MAARGLQDVPLRIPDDWDAVWFAAFIRDVLAKADVRNAIQGSGISITGQSNDLATISSSEDLQQLKDQGYVLADPPTDPGLIPNSRQLAGEPGVVTINDEGAGGNISVTIQAHGLSYSKLRLAAPLSVLGNPDTGSAELIGITGVDDTVLRRTAGALNFGTLTLAMANNHLWTYAKIQAVAATARVLGRKTAGAGDIEELTLTELLDLVGGTAQGTILFRGASAWTFIPPGTAGNFLQTLGTGADPIWAAAASGSGATLSAEILADTPTGFWKLDEASGTFADSSGNGFTLTVSGSVNYRSSVLIRSLPTTKFAQFPAGGNSARATTKLGTSPPLVGDWSIEAVACQRVFGGTNAARIFSLRGAGESATENDQIEFFIDSTGLLGVFWETGAGTNVAVSSAINLPEAIPFHLVAVKDGTANTVTFFINGLQVAEIAYSNANEPTGGTGTMIAAIGENGEGDDTSDMLVGYVAFYNAIKLTAARVAAHARAAGYF